MAIMVYFNSIKGVDFMKRYTLLNCIALALFLIAVGFIFIFRDAIKPLPVNNVD
ncbi:MAG: hypothetical protein K0S55_319, partial [Clostridia bacterium]|nr:hypothetical protein [Clostridia bacterium]